MPRAKLNLFSQKTLTTLSLFLIGSLHTLIFTFFQLPDNYATTIPFQYLIYLKLLSYLAAIASSIFHMPLSKYIGVRKLFLIGLSLNLVGLVCILLSWNVPEPSIWMYGLVLVGGISFGLALLTVINSLVTYLILEYPTHINMGIITLFIFLNSGVMLSPLLLDFFNYYDIKWLFIAGMMSCLVISIAAAKNLFPNPAIPKHLQNLRKSASLWKDLHYRLIFFVIAIIFYGIVENTISLWGEIYLSKFIPVKSSEATITLFWLFMVLGQILALLPLFYLNSRIVFCIFSSLAIIALWGLYVSVNTSSLIAFIILGGIGCSVLFPLILSSLGNQIVKDSKTIHTNFLPYIEMGSAYLLAGYIFGVGLVDFLHVWDYKEVILQLPEHFYFAIWCVIGALILYLFLDLYAKVKKH